MKGTAIFPTVTATYRHVWRSSYRHPPHPLEGWRLAETCIGIGKALLYSCSNLLVGVEATGEVGAVAGGRLNNPPGRFSGPGRKLPGSGLLANCRSCSAKRLNADANLSSLVGSVSDSNRSSRRLNCFLTRVSLSFANASRMGLFAATAGADCARTELPFFASFAAK